MTVIGSSRATDRTIQQDAFTYAILSVLKF